MKEELKVRFAEAVKIRNRGDLNSARQLFLKLAEEDTQLTAIYAVLGDICWDMGLFHTLWKLEKHVEALEEIKRFQSIADSEDYREIVREINEKC